MGRGLVTFSPILLKSGTVPSGLKKKNHQLSAVNKTALIVLVAQLCPTLRDPMTCSPPGSSVHHQFQESAQTCPTHHQLIIQPSHPLWSPLLLASIFYSIKVFPIESALSIRWPEYWSFSFSITPSSEYSELVSFRIDWFDLLQELSIGSVQTG